MWTVNEKFGHATVYTNPNEPNVQFATVPGHTLRTHNGITIEATPTQARSFYSARTSKKKFRKASTKSADPEKIEKRIKEIDEMIAQLEELEELEKLPHEEQLKILEDAEEDEDDLDSHDLLLKRRLEKSDDEEDDPEDALMASERESEKYAGTYHALEYKTASLENFYKKIDSRVSTEGDSFMRCILEGHKDLSSDKDRFLTDIGCGD